MQAMVDGVTIAASDEVVESGGYQYFPPGAVRTDLLRKSPRTAKDLECPHGVQFYDVIVDGQTHSRNAWSYAVTASLHGACRWTLWLLGRRAGRLITPAHPARPFALRTAPPQQ